MDIIFKYTLYENHDYTVIMMPKDAKILCVQNQDDNIVLWAQVESMPSYKTQRRFYIVGTGEPLLHENVAQYIGTVQLHDGYLVAHVYEVPFS